nr:proline-rich receptor-like protein kinase PERK9 [Aedes albopictus]
MATIRDQTAGPPIAGPSGRNQNTVPKLDPDPTQDPSGHLGPAFPSAPPPSAKSSAAQAPPGALLQQHYFLPLPRTISQTQPLSAQKRSSAAAHDEMVTIRDRMTRLPTAGPSGRNQYTPSTPDLDPTQDPSGHLGPTVPSGKTHPTPTPHHSQPDNLDGSSVSPGPLGSSASSGAIQRTKKLFEANPGRERPEASCKAPGTSYPTTPNPANQSETDFVSTLAGMARGEPLAPRTPQDRTDNLTGIQPPSPGTYNNMDLRHT